MPDFIVFSALSPKIFGKKIILDIHDTMLETYNAKFGSLMHGLLSWLLHVEERISCRFANKIICVNHVQKEVIVSRGENPSKITVLLNVPDHKRFKVMKYREPFENYSFVECSGSQTI